MSTVTVPENKLAELQIKASQRDELLEILEDLIPLCEAGLDSEYNIEAELADARAVIAKAKGE